MPWARVVNLARALEEIAEAGFWRIGLAGDAETELEDALGPPRVALVLGAEGPGMRPNTREHCDALARCRSRTRRKPERFERRRGRALRRERRLMVRTASSIREQVEALASREPAFARVVEKHGIPEPRKSEPGAHTLLRTIVGQQVSVAAARSMWSKLEAGYGSPPDFCPILAASDEELRVAGISRQKAGYSAEPCRARPVGRTRA